MKEFRFVNPHAMLVMDVKDEAGNVVKWTVEFAGRLNLTNSGWTADTITVGERVSVTGNPTHTGSPRLFFTQIMLANGTELRAGGGRSSALKRSAGSAESKEISRAANSRSRGKHGRRQGLPPRVSDSHVDRRDGCRRRAGAGHVHAQEAAEHVQSDYSVRAKALVSVLTKKKLINPATIDAVVDYYENQVGPHIGARLVARSWIDPEFRARLLADARAVAREEELTGLQGTDLVAVENTGQVHNLVVCTLCSCYPWPLLGLPPTWYKDKGYRARSVIDPRGVLREFGLELADNVEVRVWDSTAEIRYLVIPERPPGPKACPRTRSRRWSRGIRWSARRSSARRDKGSHR